MTKHTDSSRSTDSGVSGNAQTGAREIRKIAEAAAKELFTDYWFREQALASNNHTDHEHAQEIAAAVIEKACSRLASRVEELEKGIELAAIRLKMCAGRMRACNEHNRENEKIAEYHELIAEVVDWQKEAELLAGAHAEEKE